MSVLREQSITNPFLNGMVDWPELIRDKHLRFFAPHLIQPPESIAERLPEADYWAEFLLFVHWKPGPGRIVEVLG